MAQEGLLVFACWRREASRRAFCICSACNRSCTKRGCHLRYGCLETVSGKCKRCWEGYFLVISACGCACCGYRGGCGYLCLLVGHLALFSDLLVFARLIIPSSLCNVYQFVPSDLSNPFLETDPEFLNLQDTTVLTS